MIYNYSDKVKNLKGNAIREIFNVLKDPEMISFAGGMPAKELLPVDKVKEISAKVLEENGPVLLQYGATEGYLPLRHTFIDYVKRLGINDLTIDNTLIISGGQQAIDLMSKCFINKGDVVLVQEPTYLAVLHILKTYEAKAVGVKSNEEGLDLIDLEEKIKTQNPKFIYLVPNFLNPTGKTLSIETRKRVVEICSKNNVVILEDDPYRELRYKGEALPSIKSFDKDGTVLYATSISKTISPGLRVGVAIGSEELIRKLTVAKQAVDVHTNTYAQAIVNEFIVSGELDKQLERAIPIYKHKMDKFIECLDKYMPKTFEFTRPEGGLFIWGEFKDGTNVKDKFKEALANKVAFVIGSEFYADGKGDNCMRLNFSNANDEQIETGVKRLSEIFKEKDNG